MGEQRPFQSKCASDLHVADKKYVYICRFMKLGRYTDNAGVRDNTATLSISIRRRLQVLEISMENVGIL